MDGSRLPGAQRPTHVGGMTPGQRDDLYGIKGGFRQAQGIDLQRPGFWDKAKRLLGDGFNAYANFVNEVMDRGGQAADDIWKFLTDPAFTDEEIIEQTKDSPEINRGDFERRDPDDSSGPRQSSRDPASTHPQMSGNVRSPMGGPTPTGRGHDLSGSMMDTEDASMMDAEAPEAPAAEADPNAWTQERVNKIDQELRREKPRIQDGTIVMRDQVLTEDDLQNLGWATLRTLADSMDINTNDIGVGPHGRDPLMERIKNTLHGRTNQNRSPGSSLLD